MLGTVLSHDYVTGLYVNNDVAVPDGLKLYGSEKKCQAKKAVFKTKLQLACELIDEHKQRAKRTVMLWDSWYMCDDMVKKCESQGYSWMGEIKSNRIVFFEDKKYHLWELLDKLRCEGMLSDVIVKGELYNACVLDVFVPKIGKACFVVNVKADTKDVHLLCTNLAGCGLEELVGHAVVMCRINRFHKEGLWDISQGAPNHNRLCHKPLHIVAVSIRSSRLCQIFHPSQRLSAENPLSEFSRLKYSDKKNKG